MCNDYAATPIGSACWRKIFSGRAQDCAFFGVCNYETIGEVQAPEGNEVRRSLLAKCILLSFCVCSGAPAETWYVDGWVSVSGDGSSWETAFRRIQKGIDAASDGDTVIVARGTYSESVGFKGKNIVLRSTDPANGDVVQETVIGGSQFSSVVTFAGTEDETCVLSGFMIRSGIADNGGGILGGTAVSPTHATIRYNVITGNAAVREWPHGYGGGIAYCDGMIERNVISGNRGRHGGGLYQCNGTIRNNVIVGNSAEVNGGGLLACGGTIVNNTIVRNGAGFGGALHGCGGDIRNCIIWGNGGGGQLYNSSVPGYCCIGLWTGGGEGNISYYPHFVDAAGGDYHLRNWSPCIDAGDPASVFSDEPEPNGGRINMGAFGNTPEATSASPDSDHDGLPDEWELHFFGNLLEQASGDPDGDLLSNLEEYHRGLDPTSSAIVWYVDASATTSGDGISWETAFQTIQEGIDAAADGDTIIVCPGTYAENVWLKGENIVLQSTQPADSEVVKRTVIDGGKAGPVVTFEGTESEACVLAGFTIRNGGTWYGGGIRGEGTHATIRNNVITGNSAQWYGGGLSECDGTVEGNTISGNEAFEGGGLAYCNGIVRNNLVASNSAETRGGGLCSCGGTIENNTIADNSAQDGGGLSGCNGTIRQNAVSGNSAEGNGGGLYSCRGEVWNNVIAGNMAKGDGGGLHSCDGYIENNTIYGNSAEGNGGALHNCRGTILNCIVWRNGAGVQIAGSASPAYSCI